MERRTDPCIALLLLLNAQGSHLFYNLETRRTCVRDTWSEVPFPADILKRINKLAAGQRKKLRVQLNDPVDEENSLLKYIDDNDLFVEGPADKSIDRAAVMIMTRMTKDVTIYRPTSLRIQPKTL